MVLIIDHYDSFIDMIADYVSSLGQTHIIVPTDAERLPTIDIQQFKHIIIGPGPGNPLDKSLVNINPIITKSIQQNIPLLGICLGHQLIAQYFGAIIKTAEHIAHGFVDKITVDNHAVLFQNLPKSFHVTRYHSLIIDNNSINKNLSITAQTTANEIMAIQHLKHKIHGVQFHPESIMTEYGREILNNFLQLN